MSWTNYHSHTNFSDGKLTPADYLDAAIAKGVTQYGFSDHAPVPFECDWEMPKERYQAYLKTVKELKETYADQIEVLLSLEVDFILGVVGVNQFKDDLDYTVSSVHFGPLVNDTDYWELDGTTKKFQYGLDVLFGGDIKKGVAKYFEHTKLMVLNEAPDILGHMDKIKMHNRHHPYFAETDKWYQDLVMDTLTTIAETEVIVELNTRGWYKKLTDTFYPSLFILKAIQDLKIPITINSDCHHPNEIIKGFEEAVTLLKEIGLTEVMRYDKGNFVPVALETVVKQNK